MIKNRQHAALWVEYLIFFTGSPLLILYFKSRLLMIGMLWIGALSIYLYLRQRHAYRHDADWNWDGFRSGAKWVVMRFACIAVIIAAAVWLAAHGWFLSMPRQRPHIWMMVMMLYPVLSVWPQEMIFRAFVFRRYAPVFGQSRGYVAASSAAFSFMHIIFLNWQAVVLTFCGGVLMANTYRRSQSLALACFEHALYGCFVFTIGLGAYFYSGAAWK